MKTSRSKRAATRAQSEDVLLIAEHGAAFARRFADLEQQGSRVSIVVQRFGETGAEFRERVESTLKSLERAPDQTVFVAGEPIGPRLVEIVRTIVSSLPNGAAVVLAAATPNAQATRALAALAMTVAEMANDVRITVEGQVQAEVEPHHLWRRRIDRVLHTLRQPPASLRHAS
jgi:HAMP domain-containing protein